MGIDLSSEWSSISDPSFVKLLDRTENFHDSGFFRFQKSDDFLSIVFNPVYFGPEDIYRYQNFDACEFRLYLDAPVTTDSLKAAADAFEVVKISLSDGALDIVFPTHGLKLKVRLSRSMFRLIKLRDGEDYWSLG